MYDRRAIAVSEDLPGNEDHATLHGSYRMTQDKPSNVAASVRQRLLNIIRETGDDANLASGQAHIPEKLECGRSLGVCGFWNRKYLMCLFWDVGRNELLKNFQ